MKYKCERCDKEFAKKGDYTRHVNRKNPCFLSNQNESFRIINESQKKDVCNETESYIEQAHVKDNQCKYCKKFFTTNSNYNRHVNNNCKVKKKLDEEKENILNELSHKMNKIEKENKEIIEKNKELQNEILQMKSKSESKSSNINSNNTQNNTQNNIVNNNITNNNNIKLVAFGSEDLSKLTEEEWMAIIKRKYSSMEELTRRLHFDINKPENHNVYISNMRSRQLLYFDGKNWNAGDKKTKLNDLYEEKAERIFTRVDIYKDQLTDELVNKFDKIQDDFDSDKIKAIMLKNIEFLLYNKKDIPINTKKKLMKENAILLEN